MDKKELQNPALYTNRELSWLLFNKRVLSEARDKQLLLFERLKFLSITASNLDEFFMVRIGSLVLLGFLCYISYLCRPRMVHIRPEGNASQF